MSSWVLTAVCLQAVSWHRRYPKERDLYVSINISARHFSHPDFIGHVTDAFKRSGIRPESVKIELTESVAMNDAKDSEQTMSLLRALGVKLSIDDFGTGYSSLAYLKRFPVDALKIDQSFVREMETNQADSAIVSTIVALGRNLGLKVVAEGVETVGQFETLRSIACDAARGYLFSKPLVPEGVCEAVDQNRERCALLENWNLTPTGTIAPVLIR